MQTSGRREEEHLNGSCPEKDPKKKKKKIWTPPSTPALAHVNRGFFWQTEMESLSS